MYTYNAVLQRWIDGDTILVEIDLGFHCKRIERIRLARIDAHELRDEVVRNIRRAKHARAVAKKFCPNGSMVQIKTFKIHKDMYARYIAEVHFEGQNLSDYLLESGVVKLI